MITITVKVPENHELVAVLRLPIPLGRLSAYCNALSAQYGADIYFLESPQTPVPTDPQWLPVARKVTP